VASVEVAGVLPADLDQPALAPLKCLGQLAHLLLDPHVAGSCVLTLDEEAARAVYTVFREWLG